MTRQHNMVPVYDDVETEYDQNILKRNIRTAMEKKGINQATLSKGTNIKQSALSKLLSENGAENISIPNLVKIAQYLCVSTDELLGIKPAGEKSKDVTLADVFRKLFEIDDMIDQKMKIGEFSQDSSPDSDSVCAIYFGNEVISDKLREWGELKSSTFTSRKKFIRLWEEDVIKEGAEKRLEWGFLDRQEYTNHLLCLLGKFEEDFTDLPFDDTENNGKLPPELWYSDNLELLRGYFSKTIGKMPKILQWILDNTDPIEHTSFYETELMASRAEEEAQIKHQARSR